jgi:hypothetical protein
MQKFALKTNWYKMFENWHFETRMKLCFQNFETLPKFLRDENN